jgi:hypothetical protein
MTYTDLQCGLQLLATLTLHGLGRAAKEKACRTAVQHTIRRSETAEYVSPDFEVALQDLAYKICEKGLSELNDADLGVVKELRHRGVEAQRNFLLGAARCYTPEGFSEHFLHVLRAGVLHGMEVEAFLRERLVEKIDAELASIASSDSSAPAAEEKSAPAAEEKSAVADFLGSAEPKE